MGASEYQREARWMLARALESVEWDIDTPEDCQLVARNLAAMAKALHTVAAEWGNKDDG